MRPYASSAHPRISLVANKYFPISSVSDSFLLLAKIIRRSHGQLSLINMGLGRGGKVEGGLWVLSSDIELDIWLDLCGEGFLPSLTMTLYMHRTIT